MADRMHEYNLRKVAAVKASKPEYCTSELKEMKLQILELSKQVETLNARFASLNAKKGHSRSRSESRERNNRLCFYHYKFGDRAHKCIKPCSFQNNGIKPSEISVSSETLVYGRRLYVQDRVTKTQFLVDTGSDVSCYPKSYLNEVLKLQGTPLFAANGSHIKTFGSKLLSLDLGLQRKLQWPFVISDITKPIIGADFLQQFGLLVDLKKRCLLDPITNFKCMGRAGFSEIPNVKTISAQTFQRFINEVLYGFDFCFAYMDDILVFSKDKTEHAQHLEQIFKHFVDFGITINESKCEFGKPQVDFLGHTINSEGILPMSTKVKAIQEFPKPETVSQLRSFLGMINFYHRFIPKIAEILAPLNAYLVGSKKGIRPRLNGIPKPMQVLTK
ncbi:Transposon Ty3-I Gag-Pol polyprotein [Araneus ventricosus]|uniref:Transposon Ty3-I Gag-Pol polyprotein n=1 Tax=Araneus ventricosus TaxID=182803 RepID=A0A4Y2PSN4_ARAVE|nr:Transposon Ty3-I Gag-Pol polyprotein [Araneus ventricosus]